MKTLLLLLLCFLAAVNRLTAQETNSFSDLFVYHDSLFRYKVTILGPHQFTIDFLRANETVGHPMAFQRLADTAVIKLFARNAIMGLSGNNNTTLKEDSAINAHKRLINNTRLAQQTRVYAYVDSIFRSSGYQPADSTRAKDSIQRADSAAIARLLLQFDTTGYHQANQLIYAGAAQRENQQLNDLTEELIGRSQAFMLNYFNDQDPAEWGLSAEKFAEMDRLEQSITTVNNQLDDLNRAIRLQRKLKAKEKDSPKTHSDINLSAKDRISRLKLEKIQLRVAQRNKMGNDWMKIKRQYAQASVYLSGSAFSFLSSGAADTSKSNILAVGLYVQKADLYDLSVNITFGSSEDIIRGTDRDIFGRSILIPGIRNFSFLSNYHASSFCKYSRSKFVRNLGWGVSFNISQVQWVWSSTDSIRINNGAPVKITPFAFDLCSNYNWFNATRARVNIAAKTSISTDFGISTRWIMGNAGQSERILREFTGSDRSLYVGLLLGFRMRVERLTLFYNGVWFPNAWYGAIPGLTGGQIVSNIGFRADVVKFK